MRFANVPSSAAWRHDDARDGFEVVFIRSTPEGFAFAGQTAAVEAGEAWAVRYSIVVDARWVTQRARICALSAAGQREVALEAGGNGSWSINGVRAPQLDGCLDVDLEASSLTNAFPIHRLRLGVGTAADAPAVYVRASDLKVERLEQRYLRLEGDDDCQRYDYTSPNFEFRCELLYDRAGLVLDYPGIAKRVA